MITETAVAELIRETAVEWLDPSYAQLDGERVKVTVQRSATALVINVCSYEDGIYSQPGERYEITITAKKVDR